MSAPDNDQAIVLLGKIAAQDAVAMETFYREYARQVYAFALRQLGRPGDAEDIVIDTMYEVWHSAARFRGDSLVRTWLFSIARHRMLDLLRKRSPEASVDPQELADELFAEDQSGFDALVQQQRAEHVEHCMQRLSSEHRECVHLVFFMELPLAEVAAIQSCPENTVKTRLFHAKRNLKRCLERRLRGER